ncbi:MAG: hypothetical protein DWQ07_18600 [Chloroflexi bacterium]|nr:MAG: hypothetical protein DWQ07_18600 [Chloroflexota bacterium]MBL1194942.1 hypothetical protein [Chloroflexota bacterium]NOH12232.1 hypothetical protein [Chloroflexota bacterium]
MDDNFWEERQSSDEEPQDGIVPTGHGFTITPATCVASYTDALHAGFSLPGYTHPSQEEVDSEGQPELLTEDTQAALVVGEGQLTEQQRVQVLEAAAASRNLSVLFQGGIIGLVLGSSTAWLILSNLRLREQQNQNGAQEWQKMPKSQNRLNRSSPDGT